MNVVSFFGDTRVYTTGSTLTLLLPAVLASAAGLQLYSLVIAIATVLSMLYHYYHEQRFKSIDKAGARVLILANFYVLGTSSSPIYVSLALLSALVAWYYYELSTGCYHIHHSIWHLLSSLITTFCVLAHIA